MNIKSSKVKNVNYDVLVETDMSIACSRLFVRKCSNDKKKQQTDRIDNMS